jgi:nucleoside phosphorylase
MITIHQATFGELKSSMGHHLLESSFSDSDIPKRISNVTDLIDRPLNSILSAPVLRCFLEGQFYLVIKTFPDNSNDVRTGRVFSHALIIRKDDLNNLGSLNVLFKYLLNEVDKKVSLEPIEIEENDCDSEEASSEYLDRINASINGMVDHKEYSNTIVWVGENGYWDWINKLWPRLPNKVRANLKLGVAFNPDKINMDFLNLIYIPEGVRQNWINSGYKIIGSNVTEELNSQTAFLLSGNQEEAKCLQALLDDFDLKIDEIDDLQQLEKLSKEYCEGIESMSAKRLMILVDLVSRYNSKSDNSRKYKSKLIEHLASEMIHSETKEISALQNINWSGFNNYELILGSSLNTWIDQNLFSNGKEILNASIISKAFNTEKSNWWHNSVRVKIRKDLFDWKKEYAISILSWFEVDPKLMNSLGQIIPEEAEADFLKQLPHFNEKLDDGIIDFAEDKKWYVLHAALVGPRYSISEAFEKQLLIDKNEKFDEGLKVLSNYYKIEEFIDYTISNPLNRLIEVGLNHIKRKPEILSQIDVSYSGWIELWSECEKENISAFNYVSEPLNLTFKVLEEYLKNQEVDYSLLKSISQSEYADLSDFLNRSKLWTLLPKPIRNNFIEATSEFSWLQRFVLKNGIKVTEDKELDNLVESEVFSISIEKRDIRSDIIIELFENCSIKEELFLNYLLLRHKDVDEQLAKRIAGVIKANKWKKSFEIIRSRYVHINSELRVAVEICSRSFNMGFGLTLGKKNENLEMEKEKKIVDLVGNNQKILIVVATKLEAKKVLSQMRLKGFSPVAETMDKLVVWNLGTVNGNSLLMVKTTNMGSSGSGGSTLTVYETINEIKPNAAIMVGIAFGLKQKSQEIGTILVSKQIEGYELRKIKEDEEIARADKIPASIGLVNRFENSEFDFDKCKVDFGLMVSGEKLVNNKKFVEKIIENYPEAIGGEMEGEGFQSACHRNNTDWILMKGVCDWGYNKDVETKDEDQNKAISNVFDFLIHTLERFKF